MAEFSAKPRNRPLFGGEVSFPFTARVQSADAQVQNLSGEVASRALIPAWLLAAVLIGIIAIACLSMALILWGGAPEGAPTEPPAAQPTDEVEQPAPTEAPPTEPAPTQPPEQPTEPPPPTEPPEQPTEPPPPTEPPGQATEPPGQPTDEAGQPGEPDRPCLPIFGLILVPALVLFKKRRL